ncbi:MAG: hypothetical protein ABIQ81_02875 [Novosphingobium sp.]
MPDRDPQEQGEFYARRMREELARAESAENDGLRHLHYSWASAYRRKLEAMAGSETGKADRTGARGLGSWTTDLG